MKLDKNKRLEKNCENKNKKLKMNSQSSTVIKMKTENTNSYGKKKYNFRHFRRRRMSHNQKRYKKEEKTGRDALHENPSNHLFHSISNDFLFSFNSFCS